MLQFISSYMAQYRRSPLIREIQLGCNILSYKSVVDRLNSLEHKGYIRRIPNKHRGIRVLRRPLLEPAAAAAEPSFAAASTEPLS